MSRRPNYDLHPRVQVSDRTDDCVVGWAAVVRGLHGPGLTCVECYPGAPVHAVLEAWRTHAPDATVLDTRTLLRPPEAIEADLQPTLSADPVFGRLDPIGIALFFDPAKVEAARRFLSADSAPSAVIGPGAAHVAQRWDRLALVSMARWELQMRQRRGEIGSLGADDRSASASAKYKRAYFVDWRVGDRIKVELMARVDAVIDANAAEPRMISGDAWRAGLKAVAVQPFRVVPFFDPGVWGGQWMRERFGLPDGPPNYAWCFDCVPEENSLRLGFGEETVELPAIDLVLTEPRALLGEHVVARFGAEFPIRFDLLDTMGGQALSLQVHPIEAYAKESFGLSYTQDESYYLLDAGPEASVYLGLKEGVDRERFAADLHAAQTGTLEAGGPAFPAEAHVNAWPARKHDHFLIPAGTVHGSGRDCMVLEISATPYIFTFKLWDWGRLGMDGKPRPIHLERGLANIAFDRTTGFVGRELVNVSEPVEETADYRIERTGLHALQFIETERAWFTGPVPLHTGGGVNVLNLVAGEAAVVESPDGAFAPFEVHYAETFIVPAAVGPYTVRPARADPAEPPTESMALVRAHVRKDA